MGEGTSLIMILMQIGCMEWSRGTGTVVIRSVLWSKAPLSEQEGLGILTGPIDGKKEQAHESTNIHQGPSHGFRRSRCPV